MARGCPRPALLHPGGSLLSLARRRVQTGHRRVGVGAPARTRPQDPSVLALLASTSALTPHSKPKLTASHHFLR